MYRSNCPSVQVCDHKSMIRIKGPKYRSSRAIQIFSSTTATKGQFTCLCLTATAYDKKARWRQILCKHGTLPIGVYFPIFLSLVILSAWYRKTPDNVTSDLFLMESALQTWPPRHCKTFCLVRQRSEVPQSYPMIDGAGARVCFLVVSGHKQYIARRSVTIENKSVNWPLKCHILR